MVQGIDDANITKKPLRNIVAVILLPNQDSNLDWLIQSQKCCHYTIGHLNRLQKYTFFISCKKKIRFF